MRPIMDTDSNGNVAYSNETPKDDRLEALKNDRSQGQPQPSQGQTYLSRAVADAGAELGRWRHLGRETTVVGARPLELDTSRDGHSALALERQRGRLPIYPAQPNNVWAADAGNVEGRYPVDIGALPDMETIDGKPRAKADTGKV
jgi:hypothetical protein